TRFSRDWSSDVCSSDLTGLLQILRNVLGVEHQRRVEEAEENDASTEQKDVQRLTRSDGLRNIRQPTHPFGLTKPLPERRREQQEIGRASCRERGDRQGV